MAMLAMGFAMHTIFSAPDPNKVIDPITGEVQLLGNWFITIPVAFIWGLIIFNLDRFIVSTVKGDGTEKITLGEWGAMIPRLFMAILIGLTISAPLETYIFKREIYREWQLSMDKLAITKKYEIQLEEDTKNKENIDDYNKIKDEVAKQKATWEKAYQAWEDQMQGRGNAEVGIGPRTLALQQVRDTEKIKLDKLEQELKKFQDKKIQNQDNINLRVKNAISKIKNEHPGFLDQIMMLEKLSSHGKEVESLNAATGQVDKELDSKTGQMVPKKQEIYGAAFWPIWLVRLLFMIVEIAPVIFKFMIWKTSYDYMQDNVSQILEAKQGISMEYITDDKNNMHKVKENFNARRIAEVAKRQNELEKENAIHAITLYAEQEREKIEKDPESYIQPDSDTQES
jgi:hypothetical protein